MNTDMLRAMGRVCAGFVDMIPARRLGIALFEPEDAACGVKHRVLSAGGAGTAAAAAAEHKKDDDAPDDDDAPGKGDERPVLQPCQHGFAAWAAVLIMPLTLWAVSTGDYVPGRWWALWAGLWTQGAIFQLISCRPAWHWLSLLMDAIFMIHTGFYVASIGQEPLESGLFWYILVQCAYNSAWFAGRVAGIEWKRYAPRLPALGALGPPFWLVVARGCTLAWWHYRGAAAYAPLPSRWL